MNFYFQCCFFSCQWDIWFSYLVYLFFAFVYCTSKKKNKTKTEQKQNETKQNKKHNNNNNKQNETKQKNKTEKQLTNKQTKLKLDRYMYHVDFAVSTLYCDFANLHSTIFLHKTPYFDTHNRDPKSDI